MPWGRAGLGVAWCGLRHRQGMEGGHPQLLGPHHRDLSVLGGWGSRKTQPHGMLMSPSPQGGQQPGQLAEGAVPGDCRGSGQRGTAAGDTDHSHCECHPIPSLGMPHALLSPSHSAVPTQIFTVDQSYRIHLQFVTTVDEVQSNLESIRLYGGLAGAGAAGPAAPHTHTSPIFPLQGPDQRH